MVLRAFNKLSYSLQNHLKLRCYSSIIKEKIVDNSNMMIETEHQTFNKIQTSNSHPDFPSLINEVETKIGFWEKPENIARFDAPLTFVGRLLRLFMKPEWIERLFEWSLSNHTKKLDALNLHPLEENIKLDKDILVTKLVTKLGGAFKYIDSDRWVDDERKLRARDRKDIRRVRQIKIDALDFRNSALNYTGTRLFKDLAYLKYLNVGDCKEFDNLCMTRVNYLCETLEYLDISGTKVDSEGLTYLRLFPKLKWLNLSRLNEDIKENLPYILEILPENCVVVLDDNRPALSYGSPIPFQDKKDTSKDHVFLEDPGIGDLTVFEDRYGKDLFNAADVTHVHQLWKTPSLSLHRNAVLNISKPSKMNSKKVLANYLKKAEQFEPLF